MHKTRAYLGCQKQAPFRKGYRYLPLRDGHGVLPYVSAPMRTGSNFFSPTQSHLMADSHQTRPFPQPPTHASQASSSSDAP